MSIASQLEEIALKGVQRAVLDVEARAIGYAPVGKGRASRTSKGHRVALRPVSQFQNPLIHEHLSRVLSEHKHTSRRGGTRGRTGVAINHLGAVSRNQDFLRSFRFVGPFPKRGQRPTKGQTGRSLRNKSPAVIRQRGGKLIGFTSKEASHAGGHLRDSIHAEPVLVEGGVVRGSVVATAKYARAVEFGFPHRGGRDHTGKETQIKGRSFMRKALQEIREPFLSGVYFRR